ncbi:MAG TPA: 5-formyltetrahydrofolate cyclo-ligase, partial [Acidothermaceae bacterium]
MPADVPAPAPSAAASAADAAESAAAGSVAVAKATLRRSITERRSALTQTARTASATALADVFDSWLGAVDLVAVYLSVGTEPGTAALIEALRLRSVSMLAPVLRADGNLDWAGLSGAQAVA